MFYHLAWAQASRPYAQIVEKILNNLKIVLSFFIVYNSIQFMLWK